MSSSITVEMELTPARLGVSQYLGYACGDAANNLTFTLVSMFLLVYYTDVAGIAAATAGTIFLVARVWGAFTDIFAGRMVDKTNTRWGRFRPYFLFTGLPLVLMAVATFSVPGGLSDAATLIYAYATYMLFYLAYSLVNIPYGSLASAMTQLPDERAKLSSARSLGTATAIIALTVVVAPQISRAVDLQRSLTITTLIFAVVGVAFYLLLFATSRETVERDTAPVSLRQSVGAIRHNRPLLLLCLSALFALTGLFILQTLQVYYARDVLGNADYTIVLTVLTTGAMFLVSPAIPKIVETVGKKRAYLVAGVITVVGGAGIALAPSAAAGLLRRVWHRYRRGAVSDVGAAGRYRGVRRVEVRRAHRGHQLCCSLVHPQGGPGHRWCLGRVRHRTRRLCRPFPDAVTGSLGRHPTYHGLGARALHWSRGRDHAGLPADRGAVPSHRRRSRDLAP
jgi:glucuronide carrier protein